MDTPAEKHNVKKNCKSRKWRWFFYVFVPAVILIAFLLLLTSICHTKYEVHTTDLMAPSILFSRTLIETTALEETTLKCVALTACNLTCTGEITADLNEKLNAQQKICYSGLLALTLKDCNFFMRNLYANLFAGNYYINALNILCPPQFIAENTFKQPVFKNLTQLSLQNASFLNLYDDTFEGLTVLSSFELVATDRTLTMDVTGFLEPMAKTLSTLRISLPYTNDDDAPKIWFMHAVFENLKSVDLSHNQFPQLNANTFENLVVVETLNLSNCTIEIIDEHTFLPIANTLQYLDLRNNQLKKLDVGFLDQRTVHSLTLELAENDWDCSCVNEALINAFQQQTIEYQDTTPQCKTPNERLSWSLNQVSLICDATTDETTENVTETTNDDDTTAAETITTDLPITTVTESPTTITTITTETMPPTPTHPSTVTTTTTTTTHTTETKPPTPTHPTTTETTDTTTTAKPPPLVQVTCRKFDVSYIASIFRQDAIFKIETLNETSVKVTITYLTENVPIVFDLIYFANINESLTASIYTTVNISELNQGIAYAFCLMPYYTSNPSKNSPFNCRSHYLSIFVEMHSNAWLTSHDEALFISLTVMGVIIFIIIGGVLMYFTLRWRPAWLKGNKRIERLNPKTPKIMLHAKVEPKRVKFQRCTSKNQHYYTSNRSSDSNLSDLSCNDDHRSATSTRRATEMSYNRRRTNSCEFDPDYEKAD